MFLPIDTLLKFKRVSKCWHTLISSHNFTKLRTPFSTLPSGLFLSTYSHCCDPYYFIHFSSNQKLSCAVPFKEYLAFAEEKIEIKILQSCNGLFLSSTSLWFPQNNRCFIYNPTTNQHCEIPPPNCESSKIFCVSLAFDPSKSPHYKVVCVGEEKGDKSCQIEIYSSNKESWRASSCDFVTAPYGTNLYGDLFYNGAIHWLSSFESTLMSFNVDEEQIRDTTLPRKPDNNNDNVIAGQWGTIRYFVACRDQLHLIDIYGPRTLKFDVFEMANDYSSWFVKYQVDLNAVSYIFPSMLPDWFSVLCIVQGKVGEDSYLVLDTPVNVLVRYNFKDKTLYKLCDIGIESTMMMNYTDVYQYIESLYCLW
ncbi:hypothetical protein PIB30_022027 [Stylosanthes scabra]|uniref:F-box associated beta-propeller type 3 domain-containing protein n=1 Tax=Stylosanthes scabra TaxID=79078 RepID=A0ABU6Y986_9FABA|nr:hypothetical protein [Stylosanthes scabra]